MKKYIFVAILLGFTGVAFGASFAKPIIARFWADDYVRLPDGYSQQITGKAFDGSGVKIAKFKDGDTVCYVTYVLSNNASAYTPSISCLK